MASQTDEVRTWLVERGYNNRDLVVLKYAPLDGDQVYRRELASQALDSIAVTAARDVDPDDLKPVDDPDLRSRFAEEAERMADQHAPDDEV